MMISDNNSDRAYVWIWLPGATQPVVAGVLNRDGDRFIFNYGRSYLEREDAIPVYEPELPLVRARFSRHRVCNRRVHYVMLPRTPGAADSLRRPRRARPLSNKELKEYDFLEHPGGAEPGMS